MERVVVTGMGVVSCIGNDVPAYWESLLAGRSGIDTISAFDPSALTTRIAGEVRGFSLDSRLAKRMERFSQFAFSAAHQALVQAGLDDGNGGLTAGLDPARMGVCIGTGIGGEPFLEQQFERFLSRGPGKEHPLSVPIIIPNMASANVAIQYGVTGPNLSVATACATGNHSLGVALDMIRLGRADAMLAGGTEAAITAFTVDGYNQLRALSVRNEEPAAASRPFSASRDGFVLAEGCGVLLLESLSHARARGAEVLAELVGCGISADAHHLTAPHPEARGATQAINACLNDAQLNPSDVSYVNAHGTSTPLNDALETHAVKRVFGEYAARLPVSSIKSMVGHSLGGAAGLEAVAAVQALVNQVIPPTINLDDPDPELGLDFVPHTPREAPLEVVLSNAFAFGGQNAVVAFRRKP